MAPVDFIVEAHPGGGHASQGSRHLVTEPMEVLGPGLLQLTTPLWGWLEALSVLHCSAILPSNPSSSPIPSRCGSLIKIQHRKLRKSSPKEPNL